jgi:deoxyhypusine synthase
LKGVPVFVPAFTDSGLGLDVALNNRLRESTGHHKVRFDPFEDLEHFSATLLRQERLGMFSIGGGVPSTWAQQFGPFIELRHRRMGENVPLKRYHYGLRICSEREANSWGRFAPTSTSENGRFGEVFVDATVGLPMIVAAVLERLGKGKSHANAKRETVKPAKPKKKVRRG